MKKTIILAGAIIFMIASCKTTSKTAESKPKDEAKTEQKKDNSGGVVVTPKSDCGKPTYSMDIKIIIANNCIKCHGENGKGGYSFNSINEVRRAAQNGDLMGTIKYKAGYDKMPRNAPQLDDKTIATLECWINTGMKE
jgi:hypothetical protein